MKMKFLQHQLCSSDDSNQERSEKDSDSSMLMQREASNQDEASSNINRSLIRQLVVNQALIGYTIWTKGLGYNVLSSSATIPPYPLINFLLPIVLGAVPLLLLSALIESSESPLVSTLNLSTDMQMMRIFGPKPKPVIALVISLFLAALTGLVEETTFRGEMLPSLAQWATTAGNLPFNVPVDQGVFYGTVLSTVVFAALHVNPQSVLQTPKDAAVLFLLQCCTGGTFALLYVLTGNLAVPIVVHTIYDLYTFYKTHLVVTTQLEYANANSSEGGLPEGGIEERWAQIRGADFVQEARQTFYLMDTDRDGVVSREELRIGMYSYGLDMSRGESQSVLEIADVDGSGQIDFDEFLGFMAPEGSTKKAIKGSLLGIL